MPDKSVKYCGLTRPEDIVTALSLGAEFLGFIVECDSPRRLSSKQAAKLSAPAKGLAQRVAVTVNPDDDLIKRIADEMSPDFIQLHGDESPARVRDIKAKSNLGVIKAIGIASKTDLLRLAAYDDTTDYILLDAKPPKNKDQRGGHGLSFDWSILKGFKSKTPIILAGGLSPETIGRARTLSGINIFDVSSGVEASAGIKDPILMTDFMKALRNE